MQHHFWLSTLALAVSLSADAVSVCLANGLRLRRARARRLLVTALPFALLQGLMPILGWGSVHTVLSHVSAAARAIPYLAAAVLGTLGVRMLLHRPDPKPSVPVALGVGTLLLQSLSSSIDALSAGLVLSPLPLSSALLCAVSIALVTYVLCLTSLLLGERLGKCLGDRAERVGGIILILIALRTLLNETGLTQILI